MRVSAVGISPCRIEQGVIQLPRSSPQSGSATTKRVLFGHLQTEDVASAVARRLRTAIGIGVLSDGEKLPREVDLAKQLGVTAFSLREGLGILRSEGLIVTRVGKNGGSYVERPPSSESMAGEELVRLSATELRDLGDWRSALTTYAARLAARRAPKTTGDLLTTYVEEMVATDSSAGARRALGRFQVEVSAGAQSMRLTRAELAAHEEFDWLVQVLLHDEAHRQAVATRMQAIATSVGAGNESAAWQAGEQLVSYQVTELMRTRLQMIATRTRSGGTEHDRVGDLAAELRSILDRTVHTLQAIAAELGAFFERQPTAQALNAEVARRVLPQLADLPEVVYGLGFMAEVGMLPEAPYWLEWWQRAADGAFDRDYTHQLDSSRDDFYDYGIKDYLTQPRLMGKPSVVGPYVDHGGVGETIITVSVPVTRVGEGGEGNFVGIMAADLRIATLERSLSPWLAQAERDSVVLNADSRVLLSNSAQFNVGDLIPPDAGLVFTDLGCFGWRLGRAAGDMPHN
ncbi:putative GntR family transcriptional regulator [Microlunatus phosphovorus NM-1]|uniref:Putative GntR family transcriptional regulator n=1 Tax=Microlunatus phosphovorus (strain ATCC 700054 / DSM 10555 / JCM 9379 / NBRC 101784 / NCIMB 13414 / VKM Ac-1990 / NM-1) TaxID=1032480 RepID=F5XMU5_MICPN|nr:GntR family transcriptional regulator [Microlunatus phosphovorus]BAK34018.1 putative GntR family transcriptional regulator [Microlunatus phosphovorus NM-1]